MLEERKEEGREGGRLRSEYLVVYLFVFVFRGERTCLGASAHCVYRLANQAEEAAARAASPPPASEQISTSPSTSPTTASRQLTRRPVSRGAADDPHHREGYLFKMSPSKTVGWQRRYVQPGDGCMYLTCHASVDVLGRSLALYLSLCISRAVSLALYLSLCISRSVSLSVSLPLSLPFVLSLPRSL